MRNSICMLGMVYGYKEIESRLPETFQTGALAELCVCIFSLSVWARTSYKWSCVPRVPHLTHAGLCFSWRRWCCAKEGVLAFHVYSSVLLFACTSFFTGRHFAAGAIGGVAGSFLSYPFEMMRAAKQHNRSFMDEMVCATHCYQGLLFRISARLALIRSSIRPH